MPVIRKVITSDGNHGRLDKFLASKFKEISRSSIEKIIVAGYVKIDGEVIVKKNHFVALGNEISLNIPEKFFNKPVKITDENSLEILFEDEHILIIEKSSGISVHPGSGNKKITISDIFAHLYPDVETTKGNPRPGIVHRLDKGTSGLLILAKTSLALKKLQSQFKKREVKKKYYAIVEGRVRIKHGTINKYLTRNPSDRRKYIAVDNIKNYHSEKIRDACTKYSVIKEFKNYSYLKFIPETGRTHQLRIHSASIGNPILGDDLYGKKNRSFPRLALHACEIKFEHPAGLGKITAYSPFPLGLRNFLFSLRTGLPSQYD